MRSKGLNSLPPSLKKELRKLGEDIKHARIRRGITVVDLANRVLISETTMLKVQSGNPSVAIGIYGKVMWFLGIREGIGMLADIASDPISREFEVARLPKRVRRK